MEPIDAVRALPAEVQAFLNTVAGWPTDRWQRTIALERARPTTARRQVARTLCEAVLAAEGMRMDAWFAADAAGTTADLIAAQCAPEDHLLAIELLTDGTLALLARPALPTRDLALLLAPFLPLHLPEEPGTAP